MAKKGDGITKRKDGLYMARYTVHTPDGPKRKAIYGKKYREVEKKLNEARAAADQGLVFDAGNLAVGEFLERWLRDSVEGNVAHRTYHSYRTHVRRHIVPALGRVKLKNLSSAHVQGFYRTKLDAGLKPSTVRHIHAVFHRALKQAVRWGLVPRNVTEAVDIPKLGRVEMSTLSPEQARAFLEMARGDRYEALYVLAIRTGLRRGELLGLRWSDVDLEEAGKLRVMRQLQRLRDGGGGVFFSPPKSGKGRVIRLTAPAIDALKRHRARQAEAKLKAGGLYEDQGLVFATEKGTPLDPSNIDRRSFKPLLKRVGLPNIRFHDLRHTCATLLLSRGVHPKIVQEILGHADIILTLNTYSHVMPDMQESAGTAMDEALG